VVINSAKGKGDDAQVDAEDIDGFDGIGIDEEGVG